MKMKRRLVRIAGVLVAAGLIFQIGNHPGIQETVTVEAAKSTETKTESAVEINLPVAIVNLDEGIVQNDRKINYGSNLTEAVTENIKVTGLEDARQGIESGEYSAYIIIPNTFSEKVMTINEQPVKSTISYAMASGLELTEREKVLESIVNIYNTFSNSLSKVYTSSLLKEYHEIQDAADKIIKRDTLDMEKLLAVNGYDLMEIIQIPEMETVERNISALNLSDNYAANSTGLSNINSAYKTFVQDGQEGLDGLLSQNQTIKEKEEATGQGIQNAVSKIDNITVTEIDDSNRTKEEDEKYKLGKDNLIGNNGFLTVYNKNLKLYNRSVVQQTAEHEAVEEIFHQLIGDLDSGIGAKTEDETTIPVTAGETQIELPAAQKIYAVCKSDEVSEELETYKEAIKAVYAQKLAEIVETAETRFGGSLQAGDVTMAQVLLDGAIPAVPPEEPTEEPLESEPTEPEPTEEPVIDEDYDYDTYTENLMADANQAVNIEEVEIMAVVPADRIKAPEVTIDTTTYNEMPQTDTLFVGEEVDKLISTAGAGRNARNTEYSSLVTDYKDNVSDLKTKVSDITTAYSDESEHQSQLNSSLSGFSLGSFIQDDEVGKYAEDLQSNNQDISEKVNANNEKYETYTTNVYEATSNNVTTLQKNIADGQETSNKKLEDTLATAKSSRESSNEENVATLKSFSTRLSYTRLGELENREVYDFIAEPLLLENQSPQVKKVQQAAADTGVTAPIKKLIGGTAEDGIPQWMAIAVIAAIVLGFGLFAVTRMIVHKKKEDF